MYLKLLFFNLGFLKYFLNLPDKKHFLKKVLAFHEYCNFSLCVMGHNQGGIFVCLFVHNWRSWDLALEEEEKWSTLQWWLLQFHS